MSHASGLAPKNVANGILLFLDHAAINHDVGLVAMKMGVGIAAPVQSTISPAFGLLAKNVASGIGAPLHKLISQAFGLVAKKVRSGMRSPYHLSISAAVGLVAWLLRIRVMSFSSPWLC